jgi:uncharacterized peroxidase-related enzyme
MSDPTGRHIDAWVDTVAPADATGTLKDAYDRQSARLGEPTEYTQLGSLHPELVQERLRLYKVVEEVRSGLTETEQRVIIYVTSVLNETPHCASGVRIQLGTLGVPDTLLDALRDDPHHPDTGDARLDAIVDYTTVLTLRPGAVTEAHLDRLRAAGLSDADIVAANNLSAYYAYTNRVATGLGLRTEISPAHALGSVPR